MEKVVIDSFLDFKFLSNPLFSPDGSKIAFIVKQAELEENGYDSDLYIYDIKGKDMRRLTVGRHTGFYCWEDHQKILFNDGTQKEGTHFMEINVTCGEACPAFTLPLEVALVKKLEDGRYLLSGLEIPKEDVAAGGNRAYEIIEEVPFWSNGKGFINKERKALFIYDKANGTYERISGQWEECGSYSVYKEQVLFKAYDWKDVRGSKERISLYNMKTKAKRVLLEQDLMEISAVVLLDEDTAIVGGSDGREYGAARYPDFYKVRLSDGNFELLTEYEYTIGDNTLGTDARLGSGQSVKVVNGDLYFLSTMEEFCVLRKLHKDGTLSEGLTGNGSCDSFDVHDGHLVTCAMYEDQLAEIYLDGKPVTHFNDMDRYCISKREYMEVLSEDGSLVHGYVMKPEGYEKGRKYPAILNIHGGPRTVFGDVFHHEMQMWANEGYFVFYCNPHGSDGRGNAFGHIDGRFATIDYNDIMKFTDKVLASYPDIDATRVGVTGGSYGGFMTNWIIGHTHRFKAAASLRGVSNWISMEYLSDIGHLFVPQCIGTTTQEDVVKVWQDSPLKYAANCQTPTLFVHSECDYRCPLVEGMQMFTALKLNGCETRLCVIKNENHELSRSGKPKNRIRRLQEILRWMNRYLKDATEEGKE